MQRFYWYFTVSDTKSWPFRVIFANWIASFQTHFFSIITIMSKRASLIPISGNKTLRRELSEYTKGGIAFLAAAGITFTEISRQMNVFRSMIRDFLSRSQATFNGQNKSKCGRPFIVFDRMIRLLLRHVRAYFKTIWKLVRHWNWISAKKSSSKCSKFMK